MLRARRLGDALGDEMTRQPVPHADFAGDVEEEEEAQHEEQRAAEDGSDVGKKELRIAAGGGHFRDGLNDKRGHGERGDGVAEAHPVLLEDVGGDEWRGEAAESEEEVDEVEGDGAVRSADAVGERIGTGDHDASAHAEQKKQEQDRA